MALPEWIVGDPRIVVRNEHVQWSVDALESQVDRWAERIDAVAEAPIGLIAANSPAWIAVDLAAHVAGATLVPLPSFFTRAQLQHAIDACGMQAMIVSDAALARELGFTEQRTAGGALDLFARNDRRPARIAREHRPPIQKITFTSGTTGTPKGVRLSAATQVRTASALATALAALDIESHLSLLPYSLLLENVAGIYAPMMLGASCACPLLEEVGLTGACGFDAHRCLDAIARYQAQSVIVLPQMLAQLVERLSATRGKDPRIRPLKFVAVGGARTPPALIALARVLGLPVYEGYGLSECASVVSLNRPGADRIGSVGRALPGTSVRIAADGEIEVAGRDFAGYIGLEPADAQIATPQSRSEGQQGCSSLEPPANAWIETGDIGNIDAAGFISIVGRKRNVLVTSFGRNVAPEWPEGLLTEQPSIAQAVVFGDARPYLVAVLVASRVDVTDAEIAQAVAAVNRALPDYARIGAWLRAGQAFTSADKLATPTGRIRRDAVFARYADALGRLYSADHQHA